MKQASPEKWAKYQAYVINTLKNTPSKTEGVSEYDIRYAKKEGHYDVTDIDEEIACDFIGDGLLSDVNELRALIRHDNKLADFIRKAWNWVLDRLGLDVEKRKALQLWREAYRKTATKTEKGEAKLDDSDKGGLRYKVSESVEKSAEEGETKKAEELSESDFRILLEKVQNGELETSSYIPMRISTPKFFIDVVHEHSKGKINVMNVPLASRVEHLMQNMEEDEEGFSYGNARPHNLSADDIVTISKEMGNPTYIVFQKNGRYAMIVSFYNKERKQIIVSIDFASDGDTIKNYKYQQYMNGYNDGYYNIIVTQYEPDDLSSYLKNNEVVYEKKKMNGKYQVGSGRIVTFTHDTPFIEDIVSQYNPGVKGENKNSVSGTRLSDDAGEEILREAQNGSVGEVENDTTGGKFIPPGAEPRRDVKVPESVKEGTKVRRFARTAAEAETLTDETAEGVLGDVEKGKFNYTPISDKSAMSNAYASLDTMGIEWVCEKFSCR